MQHPHFSNLLGALESTVKKVHAAQFALGLLCVAFHWTGTWQGSAIAVNGVVTHLLLALSDNFQNTQETENSKTVPRNILSILAIQAGWIDTLFNIVASVQVNALTPWQPYTCLLYLPAIAIFLAEWRFLDRTTWSYALVHTLGVGLPGWICLYKYGNSSYLV